MCIRRAQLLVLLFASLVGAYSALPARSSIYIDFESGLGQDGQPLGSKFAGVMFATTSGQDVLLADVSTGAYSVTSDNGSCYGLGQYFVAGNVAAYTEQSDPAVIRFTLGYASFVRFGYSSASAIYMDAFDSTGTLLDSVQGSANTKSLGGIGLAFLEVTHPGIACVQIHDTGSFWMIDNLSSDAPVPEPSSVSILGIGILGLATRRRGRIS